MVIVGLLIWAVPMMLMSLAWAVGAPAVVIEGVGPIRALGRSAFLTRGHRWSILLLMVVWFLIYIVMSIGLGALSFALMMAMGPGPVATSIMQAISYVLTSIVSSAGVAALYYELRKIKEGIGPQDLAAIFD